MVAQSEYPPPPPRPGSDARTRGWGVGWPECQAGRMRTVEIYGGARVTVHRDIAEMVRCLLSYCSKVEGYVIRRADTGGFACRAIAGTSIASNHSWGLAVDINWQTNPMSSTFRSDIPPRMVSVMAAFRFFWGGWYSGTKDAMHFEFMGRPADAAALAPKAIQLWEAVENMTPDEIRDVAAGVWEHQVWSGTGTRPAGDWLKDAFRTGAAVKALTEEVAALRADVARLSTPAPVPVAIDYADLQRVVAEALASVQVDIIVPDPPVT